MANEKVDTEKLADALEKLTEACEKMDTRLSNIQRALEDPSRMPRASGEQGFDFSDVRMLIQEARDQT